MSSAFHEQPTNSAPDFLEAIVDQVAELEDASPIELEPPLYSAIDTEALDRLFRSVDGRGCVVFEWLGYEITAYQSGQVTVFDPPRDTDRSASEERSE
ncbi:HalOD1 output domain-containing protein [Natronococcus wangiae]|uniref:HalOD1 output domain-containing protein n=1 Tax=Natronococcus wangiae TaxID=3068275 RepID=UPI00273D1F9E|nr:HalOD1 output domain-containing protein [Natronococcus sp. AD5]